MHSATNHVKEAKNIKIYDLFTTLTEVFGFRRIIRTVIGNIRTPEDNMFGKLNSL